MKDLQYKWIALSCTTIGALFSVLNGSMLLIALPDNYESPQHKYGHNYVGCNELHAFYYNTRTDNR